MATWQLQDAKNRFSAVVNAALDGEPQRVTRRGQPAVVVLAAEEYERLRELDEKRVSSLPAGARPARRYPQRQTLRADGHKGT